MTGTAVAKAPMTFGGLLEKMKPEMGGLLPKHLTPERMMTLVQLAATKTPKLKECTPVSLFTAVMNASRLGLEIGQYAHLIPFKNHGQMECVMVPDYRGLIHLAVSSGKVKHIHCFVVYRDDLFKVYLGSTPRIDHEPKLGGPRAKKDIVAFYTVAILADGTSVTGEPMTYDEVAAIRERSRAKDDGPWVTDFVAMGKKTVVKRDCKFLPQSPELAAAIELDNRAESGNISTVSDLIDTPEAVAQRVSERTAERTQDIKDRLAASQGQGERADADGVVLDGAQAEGATASVEDQAAANLALDAQMVEAERAAQRDAEEPAKQGKRAHGK